MLTLFFFIFFGNVLGLMPGAANLTGNIAVTLSLALFTFLITNFLATNTTGNISFGPWDSNNNESHNFTYRINRCFFKADIVND